ncbi:MAG: MFS transporter [Mesotoga sp.]|uniref:MFS transporter n=2 Tax=Mesotoga TaxID=1184396 RepID=UPI000EF190FB|nr:MULTISPECIES: MFS transporter [unclassified Mesotoga]MDD2334645.1 MFS transporter [Mesotoga sp.]MDD5683680.1 MFS transporter [Mesotoga sp.]NLT44465.1 MFS transporter [Thermotogaceae bacterium]RLL81487.1 MFS transporter [Mesotoga sp. BH458_6_3_2_1]
MQIKRDSQFYRFAAYGFLKNLRFFDPFLILFFREMGLSFLQIGTLISVREVATNFLELPTGIIADLYGRRLSMVLSMVSYLSSFMVFYFFPSFYVYMIAMIAFAFGEAFRTGTHKAMILEYLRINEMTDMKVHYYGATRAVSQLGSAINALIAAFLVFYSGSYKIVFLASVLPYAANLVNLMLYPKELDGELRSGEKRETMKAFLGIFRNGDALKGVLNSSLYDAFFKVIKEYLQPILKALALGLPIMIAFSAEQRTSVIVGIVYFVIYIATSYASKNAGRLSGKFGNESRALNYTYIFGAILIIFSGLLQIFALQVLAVAIFFFLFILENFRRPINISYISDNIDHKTMASGLSVESQLKTLLMAIFAPLIGFMADKLGVGSAIAIAGAAMLALFAFVKLNPPKTVKGSEREGV